MFHSPHASDWRQGRGAYECGTRLICGLNHRRLVGPTSEVLGRHAGPSVCRYMSDNSGDSPADSHGITVDPRGLNLSVSRRRNASPIRMAWKRSGAVRVVVVPPLVRRGLRVAVGGVLPLLLAAEGCDIEVAPGVA